PATCTAPSILYRTTSTGQFAYCTTRVDTLPRRIRSMALSPLAPITIISACCLAAFIDQPAGSILHLPFRLDPRCRKSDRDRSQGLAFDHMEHGYMKWCPP